jgi:hypothetical protein
MLPALVLTLAAAAGAWLLIRTVAAQGARGLPVRE